MTGTDKRILLVVISLFLALFITLSIFIMQDMTMSFDLNFANLMYRFRGEKYGPWYFIFRILTEFGYVYFLVALILITGIIWKFDLKTFCLGFGCLSIYLCNELVKLIFRRPRPDESLWWMHESSTSFPSGHSMTAFFAYGILAFFIFKSNFKPNKKKILISLCGVMILIIGFSRMVLGMHYFTDVIGGFLLGGIGLGGVLFLYDYLYSLGFNFLCKKRLSVETRKRR